MSSIPFLSHAVSVAQLAFETEMSRVFCLANSTTRRNVSGQPKPKEGNPKSSISAESRNCQNRTVSAESAFFRPKVVSFCRKSSNVSAEIAVFWSKLSISAARALWAEREILPKCFGTNRNQNFWPKAEREPFRLTTKKCSLFVKSKFSWHLHITRSPAYRHRLPPATALPCTTRHAPQPQQRTKQTISVCVVIVVIVKCRDQFATYKVSLNCHSWAVCKSVRPPVV